MPGETRVREMGLMRELNTYVIDGRRMTVAEMAARAGVDRKTMYGRLQIMTPTEAVQRLKHVPTKYFLGLREMTLDAIAWELHTDPQTLRKQAHSTHRSIQVVINERYATLYDSDKGREQDAKANDDRPLSEHWCFGCKWAKWQGDWCSCPFIEGSCMKLKDTMAKPNPRLKTGDDFKREKRDRNIRARLEAMRQAQERLGGETDGKDDGNGESAV